MRESTAMCYPKLLENNLLDGMTEITETGPH